MSYLETIVGKCKREIFRFDYVPVEIGTWIGSEGKEVSFTKSWEKKVILIHSQGTQEKGIRTFSGP